MKAYTFKGGGMREARFVGADEKVVRRQLSGHFRRHNRLVMLLVALTCAASIGLWFLSYALIYWLVLLFRSISHGVEARPPELFTPIFIYSAALLVIVTWFFRRSSRPLRDKKSVLEISADLLLAIPSATLSIWGNLSAWQRLSHEDFEWAVQLIQHLRSRGEVKLYTVPLVIPDRAARRRVLTALQLLVIVKTRRDHGTFLLSLSASKGWGENRGQTLTPQ